MYQQSWQAPGVVVLRPAANQQVPYLFPHMTQFNWDTVPIQGSVVERKLGTFPGGYGGLRPLCGIVFLFLISSQKLGLDSLSKTARQARFPCCSVISLVVERKRSGHWSGNCGPSWYVWTPQRHNEPVQTKRVRLESRVPTVSGCCPVCRDAHVVCYMFVCHGSCTGIHWKGMHANVQLWWQIRRWQWAV